jgi:hypothetical protein
VLVAGGAGDAGDKVQAMREIRCRRYNCYVCMRYAARSVVVVNF